MLFRSVIEEIKSAGNCVLFIDEIHTMVGEGAAEGAVDAANILKPSLARGEMQTIGATTLDDYRKYVERDPALERRFQPVRVEEPSVDETVEILRGVKEKYEEHHQLEIADSAIQSAASLASRFIADRFLPDKAIDLIDEASSRVRIHHSMAPISVKEATKVLDSVRKEKDEAISGRQYEYAAELRDREVSLSEKLEDIKKEWEEEKGDQQPIVEEENIEEVVSMWTGIPVTRLAAAESERLIKREEALHKNVIGQQEAIDEQRGQVVRLHLQLLVQTFLLASQVIISYYWRDFGEISGIPNVPGPKSLGQEHIWARTQDFWQDPAGEIFARFLEC